MVFTFFNSIKTHESIVVNNHEQATVHAEQNAIEQIKKIIMYLELMEPPSVNNGIAYITHYPCINCFKKINLRKCLKIWY